MKYETFQHAFFNIIILRTLDKKKLIQECYVRISAKQFYKSFR